MQILDFLVFRGKQYLQKQNVFLELSCPLEHVQYINNKLICNLKHFKCSLTTPTSNSLKHWNKRNVVKFQVNEKAFSARPQRHTRLLSLSLISCTAGTCSCVSAYVCVCICFCTHMQVYLTRGQAGSRVRVIHCVCVCVIRSDVCRETECKHWVKLCLLSIWVSFIDSPLEPALIIYQVLYHEGRVGKGDRMYLDRARSYLNKSCWFVTF